MGVKAKGTFFHQRNPAQQCVHMILLVSILGHGVNAPFCMCFQHFSFSLHVL